MQINKKLHIYAKNAIELSLKKWTLAMKGLTLCLLITPIVVLIPFYQPNNHCYW